MDGAGGYSSSPHNAVLLLLVQLVRLVTRVWECRAGVPDSGMCHLVGAQPGGTAKASTRILILCVPALCCLLCDSGHIRKVRISVGLPGQYSPSLFCPVLSKYS